MKIKSYPLIVILLLWTVSNCYSVEVTSKEEKSFKMSSGGYISVIGDEGYIQVDSWDKEEVSLIITKRAWARSKREAEERLKKIDIEIEQTGNRLYIRELDTEEGWEFSFWDLFDPDRWGHHRGSTSVDFELKIPRETDLRLETDEGDIKVQNVKGDLDIEIDEGGLQMKNIAFTDVNISVDEGDVDCYEMAGPQGYLTFKIDEGTIRLEDGEIKKLNIDCDEGDILVKNMIMNQCELETDEGDIDMQVNFQTDGKYYLYSDEGDIALFLSKDVDLDVKLKTTEGRIDTDFDLNISEFDDGEQAYGKIGQGGAKLEVHTDEGDISLNYK